MEHQHDFYLFLSGKANAFTVLLPYPLELYHKDWLVALVDISLTNTFYEIQENDKIELFKTTENDNNTIDESTVKMFFFRNNRMFDSVGRLLEGINKKLENKIQFALNDNGFIELDNKDKFHVFLQENLANLLGFAAKKELKDVKETATQKPYGKHAKEMMDIHCNFVQPSIVNSKLKSMLARVPITDKEEKLFIKVTNPLYIPILKNTYSHFSFQLQTTVDGKPFPIASDVFLTLHLKCCCGSQ